MQHCLSPPSENYIPAMRAALSSILLPSVSPAENQAWHIVYAQQTSVDNVKSVPQTHCSKPTSPTQLSPFLTGLSPSAALVLPYPHGTAKTDTVREAQDPSVPCLGKSVIAEASCPKTDTVCLSMGLPLKQDQGGASTKSTFCKSPFITPSHLNQEFCCKYTSLGLR